MSAISTRTFAVETRGTTKHTATMRAQHRRQRNEFAFHRPCAWHIAAVTSDMTTSARGGKPNCSRSHCFIDKIDHHCKFFVGGISPCVERSIAHGPVADGTVTDESVLHQVHSHPIRVLVDFGYMPPNRRLKPEEIAELKAWLEHKP